MFDITGKVALVTGGCEGIGLAYVKQLLLNGVKGVVIFDNNEDLGRSIEKELNKEYSKSCTLFIKVDISNKSELEEALEKTVITFNQLDIVINNAGIYNEDDFETTININFIAVIRITKLAVYKYFPKYKSGNEAVVVNTSSIAGVMNFPVGPVYSATKHGIVACARSLSGHYSKHKTRILTICPGFTQTAIVQSLSSLDSEDVANINKLVDSSVLQPAENVGKALITVLKEGTCGSVWVSDQKPAFQLEIKDPLTYK